MVYDMTSGMKAKAIRFIDPISSWIWTEARVKLNELASFTLRYRRLDGLDDQPLTNPIGPDK